MIFILIAVLLTALAVLILWWPLKRARRIAGTSADAFNKLLGESGVRELEEEVSRGDLDAAELARAQVDFQESLDPSRSVVSPDEQAYPVRAEPFGVTALALVCAATLAFWHFGNWRSGIFGVREASHHSLILAIDHFGTHLRKHPNDAAGWRIYARAEIVLGHYAEAAAAYQKLLHLRGGSNDLAVLADYGETLVLEHPSHMDSEEDRIFNQVLRAQPDNSKALWYGGLLALAVEHDIPRAIHRFRRLLEDGPLPPAFAAIVRERIKVLGGRLPVTWEPKELRIRVGWARVNHRKPTLPAILYVYVKADEPHAPPIWVRRLAVARLPVTVVLDPSDAMLETAGFESNATYEIGARLAPRSSPSMSRQDVQGTFILVGRALRRDPLIRVGLEPSPPAPGR